MARHHYHLSIDRGLLKGSDSTAGSPLRCDNECANQLSRQFPTQEITVTTRIAKILLVCGVSFFYTLVVFNNLTDFGSNYQFVHHVLSMDSTLPGNHGMWRALPSTRLQLVFYLGIIAWELTNMILLWWSVATLVRVIGKPARVFNRAKRIAILALALSLAMWLFAFLDVGGEWFLMWQSRTWNGQEAAFRMFAVVGIVFLILIHPELDDQP